jgi:beta-alanine degradation protein BauB
MTDVWGGVSGMTVGEEAGMTFRSGSVLLARKRKMLPMPRPPAKPTVQVDNDRVIVTEWRFTPGAETTWHRHSYDYVVVPLTTGKLQIDDGKTQRFAELTAGQSYYRPVGIEHNVINANDHEFVFIEIEFKAPQA